MNLDLVPNAFASALVLTGIYTVIALAWVILIRSTRVFNFATGQFVLLGAYVFYWLSVTQRLPLIVSVVLTCLLLAIFGAIVYVSMLRPLTGRGVFAPVILTLGLAIVLTRAVGLIWGPNTRTLRKPFTNHSHRLPGNAVINDYGLTTLAVSILLFVAILTLLRHTQWGIRVRAAAESPLLASQSGINIDRAFIAGWSISAIAAVMAGVSFAYTTVVSASVSDIGLRGIAPALVGGLDSVAGVLPGAFIVASVENIAVLWLGEQARDAAAMMVLLVVLAIRPTGLFGTPEVRRV